VQQAYKAWQLAYVADLSDDPDGTAAVGQDDLHEDAAA
jgi:hypothetical protein